MLLSYGAKNFCCFKEWIEVDFRLNNNVPEDISSGKNISTLMCLKGANASGKTNAIKALSFLKEFCTNSFSYKPEDSILVDTFFGNSEASEFFIEFSINKIDYIYELVLTTHKVLSETIHKTENRLSPQFIRIENEIKVNTLFKNKEVTLRNNASIISTLHQYEVEGSREIYSFFFNILSNVGYNGLLPELAPQYILANLYKRNEPYLSFARDEIKKFDTGIENILIDSFINEKKEEIFFPIFLHKTVDGEKKLQYTAQSSGVQALFKYMILYYNVLHNGGVLALDEFDINLHPDILPHLISLFTSTETNPHSAQLLFTTHNSEIMDVMSKYRTYLFNKENGESYCYRLDELKTNIIRNDRSIASLYSKGKLGGIPKI